MKFTFPILVLLGLVLGSHNVQAQARICSDVIGFKETTPQEDPGIRRDLEIDPEFYRQALRDFRRDRKLRSTAYETYKGVMKEVSPEAATEKAQNIKDTVQRSAELVGQGRMEEAIEVLNDADVLEGTGFKRQEREQRDSINSDNVQGSTEQEYARNMVRNLSQPPRLEKDGTVVIPEPPTGNSSEQKAWAQKEWIRVAAEELLHVAQNLQVHSGGSPTLSQTMRQSPSLNNLIEREGLDLNEQNLDRGGRLADWTAEADVYASMIETYGGSFIPTWVGQDSGYTLRRHVDEALTRRGMPGREWSPRKP